MLKPSPPSSTSKTEESNERVDIINILLPPVKISWKAFKVKIIRVHCSYHKCLTVYYLSILTSLYSRHFRYEQGFKHFNSQVEDFYQESGQYRVASVNNHALDFKRLSDPFRISRIIRDPRDLVVSGYFYHKAGTEAWSQIVDPKSDDWQVVNGHIPEKMGAGFSFSSYLQDLSKEDGVMAEIDFRKNHFNSMRLWPTDDPRVKLFRYEDLIGHERKVFWQIFSHYKLPLIERIIGVRLADQLSASKQTSNRSHIRNPKSGQWKEHFSARVQD